MARVVEEFPLACPACGGDIRLIAFIDLPPWMEPVSITRVARLTQGLALDQEDNEFLSGLYLAFKAELVRAYRTMVAGTYGVFGVTGAEPVGAGEELITLPPGYACPLPSAQPKRDARFTITLTSASRPEGR